MSEEPQREHEPELPDEAIEDLAPAAEGEDVRGGSVHQAPGEPTPGLLPPYRRPRSDLRPRATLHGPSIAGERPEARRTAPAIEPRLVSDRPRPRATIADGELGSVELGLAAVNQHAVGQVCDLPPRRVAGLRGPLEQGQAQLLNAVS